MADSQSITLEQFQNRMFLIPEDAEESLRNGERKTLTTSAGFVNQGEGYAYINAVFLSEVNNLDEIAKVDDEGNIYVEYQEMDDVITPCSASHQVVSGGLPADLDMGDTVKVELFFSTDDDGNEYLNVSNMEKIWAEEISQGEAEVASHEPKSAPAA